MQGAPADTGAPNKRLGGDNMRGYFVPAGFMGFVDGQYRLFATEADYHEFMST